MTNRTKCTKLTFDDEAYYVFSTRIPEGYEGYVTFDGEFYLALPLAATEGELLDVAAKRIGEAIERELYL